MEFKLKIKDDEVSITTPISVPVSKEMESDLKRIKSSSPRNRKIVNDFMRQFIAELIVKFDAGEFDKTA